MSRMPESFNGVHATLIGAINGCDWELEQLQDQIDYLLKDAARKLGEKKALVRQRAEIAAEIEKGKWAPPEGFDKWGKPA